MTSTNGNLSWAIQVEAGVLTWRPTSVPPPAAGEVQIRVGAAGLNRADLLQASGRYPPPPGASPILGLECAGVITAVGTGVSGWRVGDRVAALLSGGGYATHANAQADQLLPVPDALSDAQAAAWPEALATIQLSIWEEGQLSPGERVLVHAGGSGIGLTAVQALATFGHPVFVTAGSPEKLTRATALGAAGGADRRAGPWEEAASRWAGPQGFDVILDPVGGDYLPQNQRVLGTGGRLVLIGLMGGRTSNLDLGRLLMARQRIVGTTLRSRTNDHKARIMADVRARFWPFVLDGRWSATVFASFPMPEAGSAHALLASDQTFGKVILTAP